MKKTLVALAALAATASFAQSSVTISGNFDAALSNTTGSTINNNGTTVATTTGTSSTSVLRFIAVEDLGGGLKATAQYNFDPRTLVNDGFKVNQTTGTYDGKNTSTGLGKDEVFVGLSGNFGNVRLGSPNSLGLAAHGTASPLGTGIGSGYALSQAVVTTRYDRAVAYNSPVMSGFSVAAQYAPGGDSAALDAATAVGIPNNRNVTELALSYANGPLNVMYVNIAQAAQTNKAGYYTSASAAGKSSSNMLSANYTIGATTLYVGFIGGDAIAAAATPSTVKGNRIAVKQTLGSVDLIVQAQDLTTTTSGVDTKATLIGLRADYNLSKTAAVYLGYQKGDTGLAYDNSTTAKALATGDNTIVSVGLRKSF